MMSRRTYQPTSIVAAPRGSRCERCGEPAERQIRMTSRALAYDTDGLYCRACGEKYLLAIDGIIGELLVSQTSSHM